MRVILQTVVELILRKLFRKMLSNLISENLAVVRRNFGD